MIDVIQELFKEQDLTYRDFDSKLIPNIPKERFIGVRVPKLRLLAKQMIKNDDYEPFLNQLPHFYVEENILHSIILSSLKDENKALIYYERFLPYIDNWAVCDVSAKSLKKHPDLLEKALFWVQSNHPYTIRFGINILMDNFLEGKFDPEYLKVVGKISHNDYYVKMMIAWYFATALAKQYDHTIIVLQERWLEKWTHNKTIQKAIESYRISQKQKDYLKSLKY